MAESFKRVMTWQWHDFLLLGYDSGVDENNRKRITVFLYDKMVRIVTDTFAIDEKHINTLDGLIVSLDRMMKLQRGLESHRRQELFALLYDLRTNNNLIDYWECEQCNKKSFAIPDEDLTCVWCGRLHGE